MEMSSNSSGTTNPEDEPNTDPETQEPEKPVEPFNGGRDTDGWEMFHAIFNTQNLCFIIGMCWSGTKWSIPLYIDTIVNRTENTLPCTILFFCGTVFRRLKFSGVKWLRVVGNLIMHHIVMPLIALIWCLATGVNGNTATICVLMFTLPLDSIGVENHAFDEYKDDSVSTTFFLSHIIGFPLFMAWLAVINETKIFN
ncbi:Auxin Efflux Carrier family protein [Histomonas meleagridis]|uniref:Auxin Efflux Carrier family protein n=1 Tax=Histomonas meleagridis TaxID=135588 RepID=UPI003559B14F|nr:Auxin Efflux Carrier family protein [Histomonas meleagridis]KAH0804707.1 Auxin Efflux Carrier family protein [Histomonas meleagridis]